MVSLPKSLFQINRVCFKYNNGKRNDNYGLPSFVRSSTTSSSTGGSILGVVLRFSWTNEGKVPF
jgi:carbamoylphosphate synthase large subunit